MQTEIWQKQNSFFNVVVTIDDKESDGIIKFYRMKNQ